jgi:hypothetical protein
VNSTVPAWTGPATGQFGAFRQRLWRPFRPCMPKTHIPTARTITEAAACRYSAPRPPALCRRPLPLVLIRRYLLPLFPIATRSSSASLCAEPSRRSATRPSPTPPRLGQPEVPPRAPPPNLDEHDVASSKRGANAWPDTTPRAEEPLLPPSMLS